MSLPLRHLLAMGGCVMGSVSMPTTTQAVLSVPNEAPAFGVGFDLTASYGQALQRSKEKVLKTNNNVAQRR